MWAGNFSLPLTDGITYKASGCYERNILYIMAIPTSEQTCVSKSYSFMLWLLVSAMYKVFPSGDIHTPPGSLNWISSGALPHASPGFPFPSKV